MADNFELEWRGDALLEALAQPFHETNELFFRAADREITDAQWQWPNPPHMRDVVDTGQLRRSYFPLPRPPWKYEHTWTVEYALPVHEGAVFRDGSSMPARPWTRVALRKFRFADTFARIARARLRTQN